MGFKLMDRVYELDKDATTPSEQAVLLALAFRANDKTLLCYPKQETLVEMTHLSRSAIANALNALRKNGFINWKTGGLTRKKGKYGRPLSNDYILTLPERKSKNGQISSRPSVLQEDTPVSCRRTLQCPAGGHSSVLQEDTPVSCRRTPTEINNNNINSDTNTIGAAIASGINSLEDLLEKKPRQKAAKCRVETESAGPIFKALEMCGIRHGDPKYLDNYRAFMSVMQRVGESRTMDTLYAIESERRQGELDNVDRMPAYIMSRLKDMLPKD